MESEVVNTQQQQSQIITDVNNINNRKQQSLPVQQQTTNSVKMKSAAPQPKKQKPRRSRIRSELDRLLSDEGTRKLLKGLKKPKPKTVTGASAAALFRKRLIAGEKNNDATTTGNGKINANSNIRRGTRERGFRNGTRGRGGVVRRAVGVIPPPPPPVPGKAATAAAAATATVSKRGRSRSGSPAKTKVEGGKETGEEERKIDYRLVNISRRSKVAWITVIGSNGGEVKEEKENGDSGKAARRLDGGFGTKILQSLECAFRILEQDNSISVIVLQNSHSRYFCNGIDVSELIIHSSRSSESSSSSGSSSGSSNNNNNNNSSSINNSGNGVVKNSSSNQFLGMIRAMKSLITTLNSSRKLLVASVTGDCIGFGVMILPLFDFVYANDKSMFKVHYNALGQSPEGVGLMCGLIKGGAVGKLTNLIYLNTPLTATEAQLSGLVTEILWPARYQEELASRIHSMSSSSSIMIKSKTTMKNLKAAVRLNDLWGEFGVVEGQWASPEFQGKAKAFLSCDGVIEDFKGGLLNGL